MTEMITSYSNKKTIEKVSTNFGKKSAKMVFMIHGFRGNIGLDPWMTEVKNALNGKYESSQNIIIGLVDWGWGMYLSNLPKISNMWI